MNEYKTILKTSEGTYKDKGSKFISYLHRIHTEEEAKELLKAYRKKYFDARHICFAMILGETSDYQKSNDDGEPSHTAGTPILNCLRSYELTNVICIVIRYFGGTKLGVSGLIDAYKAATEDALKNCKIITEKITKQISITTDYLTINEIMYQIKRYNVTVTSQEYRDSDTIIIFKVENAHFELFNDFLKSVYKIKEISY